jgi:hypothetical protein
MIRGFSRRGQPLVVLTLLLGSWVSARAMMWDADAVGSVRPLMFSQPAPAKLVATALPTEVSAVSRPASGGFSPFPGFLAVQNTVPPVPQPHTQSQSQSYHARRVIARVAIRPTLTPQPAAPAFVTIGKVLPEVARFRLQPSSGVSMPDATRPEVAAAQKQQQKTRRWSVDSWVLWRRGGQSQLAGGFLSPSYGASQAGMVLRYRLQPDSALRPNAYLRTSTALDGSGEREAALGLSARPFAEIPLIAAGEARLTSTPGGLLVRPAAFLVTELPPVALPYGLRGEAYAQAGYVGGQFATAFADGQIRLDHRLIGLGRGDLRFGGGAWGGAQRGASRLDAGPSLTVTQNLRKLGALRLGADWRFRVAGNAAPASGPTITLSAGF